jgi:hypothetical protein
MSASIYDDKLVLPTVQMLIHDLKDSKKYLDRISSFISDEYGNYNPEWKYYNKRSGWVLKLFSKKRNVLFVVPYAGFFKTTFVFGDKAAQLVFNSNLPANIRNALKIAQKYMEGRLIVLEVKNEADLNIILELIQIKMTPL